MRAELYSCIFLIAACRSNPVFERIGDGFYYIGNEKTAGHYFDWFVARQDCWRGMSSLLSVEKAEELRDLEQYILSRGFSNGSTFATSGNRFNTKIGYTWEGVNDPVTFARWLPGTQQEVEEPYLSLQLVNSTLYMRPSYGQDDYYICEYKLSLWQFWLSLEPIHKIIIFVFGFFLWLGYFLVLLRAKAKKNLSQSADDKIKLIP